MAFFLSGAAALVYELLWFRLLGHIFGSTATATATLLAAFLFGLGLGALLVGRLSDGMLRWVPLLYAALEVAIALYGLASRFLLERGAALYALGHEWASGSPSRLLLARFVVSFGIVALPTTLMGGTFPLMVQLLRSDVGAGRATGRAYALNTAGAALGALALPAVLLPRLGVLGSLVAAAAANLAAAALTLPAARAASRLVPAATDHPERPTAAAGTGRRSVGPVLLGFFLSSFVALALETVWARHLGLVFGAQIYTFAVVLFAYLSGLFLGGAAYARLRAGGAAPERVLRGGLVLAGATVAATLPFLDRLLIPQIELMRALGVSHRSFLLTSGLETVVLILPAAVGFGLVFPAVVDWLVRQGGRAGASVGSAYIVNTVGTTLGSAAAGFGLVPWLGTQRTLEVAVVLLAAALLLAPWERGRPALRYGIPALALMLPLLPRWDWRLAHTGYSKDPPGFVEAFASGTFWATLDGFRVPFLGEGAEATVAVVEDPAGSRTLYVNGKPDASDVESDMISQRMLAVLPALFHPDPRRAFVLGLGSGTTAATLLRFPVESVDVAEISPEVVEAAEGYFARVHEGLIGEPRVRVHVDDGRNFLHFAPDGSYDLIISEPSNPWMAGVSGLFTDEFFALARVKLRPGGILCQWFHYYTMSFEHIRLLVRTFARNFPECAVFVAAGTRFPGDLLIVGSNGPLRLSRLVEDPGVPTRVREDLAQVGITGSIPILFGLVASPADVAGFAGQGPLNTDDRPILELEAPRDRFESTADENLGRLLTATPRAFLPFGGSLEGDSLAEEIRRDGFGLPLGVPGEPPRGRGVTVLTRVRASGQGATRWVLLGTAFGRGIDDLALHAVLGAPADPRELPELAGLLAGGSRVASTGEAQVQGHAGRWFLVDSERGAALVLGWTCAVRERTLLVSRSLISEPGLSPEAAALDLAGRFPCAHEPGRGGLKP